MAGLSIGPLRWGMVVVALDPVKGHEQAGTRRALVVSYEPFHRSGLMTVCPVTAARSEARYPGDVPLPQGEAGQTKPAVVLCSQVRTISQRRIRGAPLGYVTDPKLRRKVRVALAHHLGLDIPTVVDALTERGEPVAHLTPLPDRPTSTYERMLAEGRITPAARPWAELPEPLPPLPGKQLSEVLQEMRDEDPR